MGIEEIHSDGRLIGLIIRREFEREGITFFTPSDYSQQLAYMKRPPGYTIDAHVHNPVNREVTTTQEVLMVRRGRVRVDFYSEMEQYLESRILCEGDVILLCAGGHGFEFLEEAELIEVKQGPYSGDRDKTRFNGVPENAVRLTTGDT